MSELRALICVTILLVIGLAGALYMIASIDDDTTFLEGVVIDKYRGWGMDYIIVEDADGVRYEINTNELIKKYQVGDVFSEELSTWKVTKL